MPLSIRRRRNIALRSFWHAKMWRTRCARLQSDADALKASAEAERAAKKTFDLAQRQRALGTISLVAVLNAEQSLQQAELSLVQAQANRYADTAALFQALGGGWWNRTEETSL